MNGWDGRCKDKGQTKKGKEIKHQKTKKAGKRKMIKREIKKEKNGKNNERNTYEDEIIIEKRDDKSIKVIF